VPAVRARRLSGEYMIQRTFDVTKQEEITGVVAELQSMVEVSAAKDKFLQVGFYRFSCKDVLKLLAPVQEAFPDIKLLAFSLFAPEPMGLNADGTFIFREPVIKLGFRFFMQSEVKILIYDLAELSVEDMIFRARRDILATPAVKGVSCLCVGEKLAVSDMLERMTAGLEDIPVFGMKADVPYGPGMETAKIEKQSPCIFYGKKCDRGVALVLYTGAGLQVRTDYIFGWKPIGKKMAITVADKDSVADDTLITGIDGMRPEDAFKKYFGIKFDQYLPMNTGEFPLTVTRNGLQLARIPMYTTPEGNLLLIGGIRQGEYAQFSYSLPDEILAGTRSRCADMAAFNPEALELFPCANRSMVLREDAKKEIDFYRCILPEILYSYGSGEIYRWHGQGALLNSSLVAVGMREGAAEGVNPAFAELSAEEKTENTGALSLPVRLLTFMKAMTGDLTSYVEKASRASESKSAFLSNMSHEIRTPINAVLGLDEMILRESSEDTIRGYARDIQSSGRSLLTIINDILDFSKIEAGKMEIINAEYDLRQTLSDIRNMLEVRALDKGLEFIISADDEMPHLLYGDEVRIKQCMVNILTNAVKYTRVGSVMLSVGCKKKDEDHILLNIKVSDTGIGIKKEDMPKLFLPFERIEERRNRSVEGTGLGMSIVNSLLAQMGSRLSVESTYGQGSSFSFSVEQRVCSWERLGSRDDMLAARESENAAYMESFQAPAARILVVDDMPMNLVVIKGLLKMTRVQVDTAASAAEGLVLAQNNAYHLIFIDHLMPKVDGIEMLGKLRSDPLSKNRHTVCIALTANAVSGAREMYLAAGFDDYLSKPVEYKKLEAMLADYLPKELLLTQGQGGFIDMNHAEWNGVERRESACVVNLIFNDTFKLDIEEALKNCGDKDVFMDAVKNFYDGIEEKATEIEGYVASGDWKNFTVQVHALKSSARLIGMGDLSERAKAMEAAGNAAQRGDRSAFDDIAVHTPKLLADYRSCLQTLAPLRGKVVLPAQAAGDGAASKPAIPEETYREALSALRELVSAFDFGSADAIIAELDSKTLPENCAGQFAALKRAVRSVDADAVLKLLDSAG